MEKTFEIHGCVEVPLDVTEEAFYREFIGFIESKNWSFGGGINMVVTHKMNLHPVPFAMIASRKKTIELRLNDVKRQQIRVGDRIEFTNTDSGEVLLCDVVKLHHYDSFKELYADLPLLKCGYTEDDIALAKPEDMDAYYRPERQRLYGVLGIEIRQI